MNPFYLLLFCFLAISFSLILIQRDMRIWEKFCLLINPALLVLALVMLVSRMTDERTSSIELVSVSNTVSEIVNQPGIPGAKETADVLEQFSTSGQNGTEWNELVEKLRKIRDKNVEK